MAELQGEILAVVKPDLDVSCTVVCRDMHVEMCHAVWRCTCDDTVHDSLERGKPVAEVVVKLLGTKAGEIGTEQHVGFRSFCYALDHSQLVPRARLASSPIVLVSVALACDMIYKGVPVGAVGAVVVAYLWSRGCNRTCKLHTQPESCQGI